MLTAKSSTVCQLKIKRPRIRARAVPSNIDSKAPVQKFKLRCENTEKKGEKQKEQVDGYITLQVPCHCIFSF